MKYENINHEGMIQEAGKHWRTVILVLLGAILLLFVLMFILVLQLYPTQAAYVQMEAATPEAITEQAPVFSVGDVAVVGTFAVTLNSASWEQEGKWLVLDITLANIGEHTEFVSGGMYTLYDEDNHPRGGMSLGSEMELQAGNETGGKIVFHVDPGHSSWRLVFNADYFYSPLFGKVTFLINENDIKNLGEGGTL